MEHESEIEILHWWKGKSENERGDLEECPIGNGQNWKEQLYVIVGTGFL